MKAKYVLDKASIKAKQENLNINFGEKIEIMLPNILGLPSINSTSKSFKVTIECVSSVDLKNKT